MFRIPVAVAVMVWSVCLSQQMACGDDSAELTGLIDQHIQAALSDVGLKPASQTDDAEFLRRVTLDLHGVVPSAEAAAAFLNSREPAGRDVVIDELLASPRFGKFFGDQWSRYLISPLVSEQRQQTEQFTRWLADRFHANDGWDRIAFDLLTATGRMEDNPAVTYLIEGRHPLGVADLTDLSSRYFLGVRLNCAQCHDHPFASWKQDDYWGMAAFFVQIQTPGRPKQVYQTGIQDNPKLTLASLQDTDMLEGFRSRQTTFPGGGTWEPEPDTPHREALAHWITSPENPFFARAMVNRLWWHFMGRGIVHPVDDMHDGNEPSHPELLEVLSQRFAGSGFDLKLLCRAIVRSRTYQQTSRPGSDSERELELFARMPVKVLSPEQLYDSLESILGPPVKSKGRKSSTGDRYEFCQFFATDRDPDPLRYERGIPHALRLMNSPQFAGPSVDSLVSRLAGQDRPQEAVVDDLFLTIFARRPTPDDRQLVQDHFQRVDDPRIAYRQLAWALLLSSEFQLNR